MINLKLSLIDLNISYRSIYLNHHDRDPCQRNLEHNFKFRTKLENIFLESRFCFCLTKTKTDLICGFGVYFLLEQKRQRKITNITKSFSPTDKKNVAKLV